MLDTASGSKSAIGSGFYVHPRYLLTNYHVVSELVFRPEQYSLEIVHDDGRTEPVELANIDVVHDLALLRAARPAGDALQLSGDVLSKGSRVYAFGNPYDLGASIIEGTYNGLLEDSLYEKIHFSGALNPGMSGGPAIARDGRVVGVNVSTAGNEVSFLVPAKFAIELLAQTLQRGPRPDTKFV